LTPYVLWFVQQPGGYGTEAHSHLMRHGNGHDAVVTPEKVDAERETA
jgi:hypothetical protein